MTEYLFARTTDIDDLEAALEALELAVDADLALLVPKALFDANTILYATTDDTPAALPVAEQTLVGRLTGGEIAALTVSDVRTLLSVYTQAEVDALLLGKSDTGHTHDDRYYTESEVDTLLLGKSDTSHTHDSRYYTETEVDTLLSGKSDTSHNHTGVYEPVDADILRADTSDDLAAGFTATSADQGTKSSGTFTPTFATRNVQHCVNGGAFTLGVPVGNGSLVLDITNNASAGAITTSGFTKVSGDSFTTTDTHKFRCFITVGNAGSHLHVVAFQ